MTPEAHERLRVRLPLLAVCLAAWLLLLARPHAMHQSRMAASVLMFAAMMAPLMASSLRHVREQSLARRRLRAMGSFAIGYALVWIAAGMALGEAALRIPAAAAIVLVAAWQCSPAKQRCLNRCHAHPPLAAFGIAADFDALRFGLTHALWCAGSCSALMLLPMLWPPAHLAAMAAVTLWLAGERLSAPQPPQWTLRGPAKTARLIAAQASLWMQRIGARRRHALSGSRARPAF